MIFWVAVVFLLPVSFIWPPRRPFLPYGRPDLALAGLLVLHLFIPLHGTHLYRSEPYFHARVCVCVCVCVTENVVVGDGSGGVSVAGGTVTVTASSRCVDDVMATSAAACPCGPAATDVKSSTNHLSASAPRDNSSHDSATTSPAALLSASSGHVINEHDHMHVSSSTIHTDGQWSLSLSLDLGKNI